MKQVLRLAVVATAAASVISVAAAQSALPQFVDVAAAAGVVFHHTNGMSADKHLVETMGSGGLFFDYDGDGWIDIFLVDGGSIASRAVDAKAQHRLFHNRGASAGSRGTLFEDVTARSGIRHTAYGMGACSGDYDADGRPDLYITSYGPNALYRNKGDGTFADVTATAKVGDPRWSASCAFADLDGDGDLDLWVTNYVDADRAKPPYCGDATKQQRMYCHPLRYEPLPNTVYRNDGNGTFTDVSVSSGVAALKANGLGVVITDADGDGRPDVFVANDTMPNFLFRNEGGMKFKEAALASGMALAADGRARAGMGIDAADYNSDGRLDLMITNLDFEMHTVYRGLDRGLFADSTLESGIGFVTLPFVGFGVAFLDYDNDTQQDVAIATGHILDNAPLFRPGSTYMQRKLLFRNTNQRRFTEVGRQSGPGFATQKVSRGLSVGDIDNDGDLDLLVTTNGQNPELLRNEAPSGTRGHSVLVRLRGAGRNPDAIGARIRVTTGALTQTREIKAGSSYLSQNDLRAHFGLGGVAKMDRLEVRWPSGKVESVSDLAADQIVTMDEGRGVTARVPFTR